jgi:hypothetical protein
MSLAEKAITETQQHVLHYEIRELEDGTLILYLAGKCIAVAYSATLTDATLKKLGLTTTQVSDILCEALHQEVRQLLPTVSLVQTIQGGDHQVLCGYLYRENGLIKCIQFNVVEGDLSSLPLPVKLKIQRELVSKQ